MKKLFFVSLLCCFIATSVFAIDAVEEWIDIPVVINIVDDSDSSSVEDAIKKANEILGQAKIRLVVKKTNNNVNVGNGSAWLTEDEGEEAQEDGQEELSDVCGDGKGIKITVADDVWVEEQGAVGWAIHRNPVVFVEPDDDANEMGLTMAHEICHSLTLESDTYDPNDINDLMYGYTGGGTDLDPNEIEEIRETAKRRGDSYFVMPEILPGQSVAIPCGFFMSIDARGGFLDKFYDELIFGPAGTVTEPNDPSITYTDLREITLFADEPHEPGTFISLQIQLGGLIPEEFPVESFFDVFADYNPSNPEDELQVHIELKNTNVVRAEVINLVDGLTFPIDVLVHRNDKYDSNTPPPIPKNHSLEAQIPIELVQLQLTSVEPIVVRANSLSIDNRLVIGPIQSFDSTDPFPLGLTRPCPIPTLLFSGGTSVPGSACSSGDICYQWNLLGCGFTPGAELEVEISGKPLRRSAYADGDGCLTIRNIGSSGQDGVRQDQEPVYQAVLVKETDDSGPKGAKHAMGFFRYCQHGRLAGDEDNDCDMDFVDLALSLDNWLVGAGSP